MVKMTPPIQSISWVLKHNYMFLIRKRKYQAWMRPSSAPKKKKGEVEAEDSEVGGSPEAEEEAYSCPASQEQEATDPPPPVREPEVIIVLHDYSGFTRLEIQRF